MEKVTKLGIGAFVALSLIVSGVYFVDRNNAYYCESKDLVGICDKLSSGKGTRCYFEETYKTCSEGWVKLEEFYQPESISVQKVTVFGNGELYICEVLNGEVNSYSICLSSGGRQAYMGELV